MSEMEATGHATARDRQPSGEALDGDEGPPSGVRAAGVVRWALIVLLAIAATSAWTYHGDVAPGTARRTARSQAQYQCPMHASVVQDQPGQCSICGMELVPVASSGPARATAGGRSAGEVPGLVPIEIAPERTQLIGMRTAKVTRQRLTAQLRAVGFVSADESSISMVTARFSGWVEEVRAAQPGQRVAKGQVLAMISGPELWSAQEVFLAGNQWAAKYKGSAPASRAGAIQQNNALQRLGIARPDVESVARRGAPLAALPLRAPVSGYIARKSVQRGLYVQPGAELFQIVDLSSIWVVADLHEQDASRLQLGQRARLSIPGRPGETFDGHIDFIYPALDLQTRTLQARMRLANPDLKLRPGMYGELLIDSPLPETLTVPREAVVDTGELQYVFLARAGGRFEPRIVRPGASAEGRVQVLDGVTEDEVVVTTANFLVDSESRLHAAIEAFGAPPRPGPVTAQAATAPHP